MNDFILVIVMMSPNTESVNSLQTIQVYDNDQCVEIGESLTSHDNNSFYQCRDMNGKSKSEFFDNVLKQILNDKIVDEPYCILT